MELHAQVYKKLQVLLIVVYVFPIKLCVLLVVSMVETALHLEYVHVPLCGLAMIVGKVYTYVRIL